MRLKPPPYIPRAILNISFPTRRWWRSWAVAGSPAVYVLIYGIYQYHNLHSKHQPDAISSFVVYSCVSALAQPSQPQHHRCNTTAALQLVHPWPRRYLALSSGAIFLTAGFVGAQVMSVKLRGA